jgi:hypothetical protein
MAEHKQTNYNIAINSGNNLSDCESIANQMTLHIIILRTLARWPNLAKVLENIFGN